MLSMGFCFNSFRSELPTQTSTANSTIITPGYPFNTSAAGDMKSIDSKIAMPPAHLIYDGSDEEINQVTGNTVDYNTNDYKYGYDEYSENDYIATGDIISKKNYNNNANYSSSLDSTNNISNTGQIMAPTLPALPASTLSNKSYCDSASTHQNSYNFLNNQKNDQTLADSNFGYANGNVKMPADHILPSTLMYGDQYEAEANNLILNRQQEIDPNEVYEEDYEEDIINQQATAGYNQGYNQQYQSPYYNYQEDYFNEEDEYKYLEREREEASMEEQQKSR